MISPWLFNVYMDGVLNEVNARMLGRSVILMSDDGREWKMNKLVFSGDTPLVTGSKGEVKTAVLESV